MLFVLLRFTDSLVSLICKFKRSNYLNNYVIIYCLTETKEESPEHNESLIFSISVGVPFFAILVIGMCSLVKYGKLRKVLCCSVSLRREERILVRHEESHEMISPSKQ